MSEIAALLAGVAAIAGAALLIPMFELGGRLWRRRRRIALFAMGLTASLYLGGSAGFAWSLFCLGGYCQ